MKRNKKKYMAKKIAAAKDYLMTYGISSDRISVLSYEEDQSTLDQTH